MMRYFPILFVLGLLILSCNSNPDGFVLTGELRGDIEDGTKVFLRTTDSLARSMVEVDTALVEKGAFTFIGNGNTPQLHYLFIDGIQANTPVIIENGAISFKAQKDSLQFAKVKGTLQNDVFMDFLEESRRLGSMQKSMTEDFKSANMRKDTAVMEAVRAEYLELQEKAKNYELDFVKEHPEALISALIIDKAVTTKALPVIELQEIFNTLTPEIKETRPGKRIAKQLKEAKATAIGSPAPQFSGPTPDGSTLALSDVKGKLTLIDFWAAWCKPCRAENPNIVAVYQKYKDKGMNVIGVSLDKKQEDWLRAIETDGLEWNHISNLQYFQDPIAQLYKVNAIPAAFLLDENGVIVAKNLRGAALEEKVAELLN